MGLLDDLEGKLTESLSGVPGGEQIAGIAKGLIDQNASKIPGLGGNSEHSENSTANNESASDAPESSDSDSDDSAGS